MSDTKRLTKKIQREVGATQDGIWGNETATKVASRLGIYSKVDGVFPHESDAQEFYGAPGRNHVLMDFPYPMRLSWEPQTVVNRTTINKKCAASAKRIFQRTLDHYGLEKIQQLGLDLFGGCYNNRNKRGGSSKSMHAYACAIDLNPQKNPLKANHKTALFAQPEYDAFWEIVEDEGWVSLGREKDFDWMHFQAARI